jgi:LmbE family N-acetylglucosaminyl deacetylase
MKKILVIGAHYDDAELGAGGSMAKWVDEGREVFKLTLSDNETNFTKRNIKVNADEALLESNEACKTLGVKEILDFPLQNCTNLVFDKKQMQLIESYILDNMVDTLVMHNIFDIQQDHVHAATISYVAGRYCNNLLAYQSNKYILPVNYYPRYFVDITKTIDKKIDALNCYSYAHNRYKQLFEMTIKQNRVYGYQCNMNQNKTYAEAFKIIKFVEK